MPAGGAPASTTPDNTAFHGGGGGGGQPGGGIFNGASGTITLVNSTLWGNSGGRGAGIYNAGTAILTNTTVTGNFLVDAGKGEDPDGAGILNAGTATLTNTIVAGNGGYGGTTNSPFGQDFVDFGTTTFVGLNIIGVGNDSDGSDHVINTPSLADLFAALTTIDPDHGDPFEAGLLANNGGPVPTVAIKPGGPAHSPPGTTVPADATDADQDGNDTEPLPVDARDFPRLQGGGIDVGALEIQEAAPPPAGEVIVGDGGGNTLNGTLGDDTVHGLDGNDSLLGNDGDDDLFGGNGNDTAFAGNGDDEVVGGNGDDFVHGNRGNDTVHGDDGNDIVLGGQGNDAVFGDAGDDVLVHGNLGDDTAHGGDGNDVVRGGQGSDRLYGDDGNDLLFGDLHADTLTGGNGNDTFAFDAASATFNPSPADDPDQVLDFDLAGDDRLDLGAPGSAANFLNSGESAPTLTDAAAIANGLFAGGVIYVTVNVASGLGDATDNTVVFWDTDGDGDADEAVALVNTPQAHVGADDIV
jgi:Ca2+-binding RTX toxin-like protein